MCSRLHLQKCAQLSASASRYSSFQIWPDVAASRLQVGNKWLQLALARSFFLVFFASLAWCCFLGLQYGLFTSSFCLAVHHFCFDSHLIKMDSQAYRQIIYFLADGGHKPKEIHSQLISKYGSGAPSYATVTRWFNEKKRGRTDLSNRPSTGRPPEVITPAKIEAAKRAVASNAKISCRTLALELSLCRPTVKTLMERCWHNGFHMNCPTRRSALELNFANNF